MQHTNHLKHQRLSFEFCYMYDSGQSCLQLKSDMKRTQKHVTTATAVTWALEAEDKINNTEDVIALHLEFQVAGNLFSDLYSGRQAALEQRFYTTPKIKMSLIMEHE